MRKRNIGNEFPCGGLFHVLFTVSLRGKGHMDWWDFPSSNYCLAARKRKHGSHECFFCLCLCFISRTQIASTTGGHKSHLCFPIITYWNINKGLFDSLFVFPIEWHQTKKIKTAYTGDLALLLSFFKLRIERIESMYNVSYFYFLFSSNIGNFEALNSNFFLLNMAFAHSFTVRNKS